MRWRAASGAAPSIPTIRVSCGSWWRRQCATIRTLQAVLESVNRYSSTVYDVNIGDSQGMTLLSTNPDNDGKPLPLRPNYEPVAQGQSPAH